MTPAPKVALVTGSATGVGRACAVRFARLGFAVVEDPVKARSSSNRGELSWGGAASTAFWIDPVDEVICIFMTQLLPSSTYPVRSELRQLVYQALID